MTRCLLVSNRLPVAYNDKSQSFTQSSGGLVSAIKGLDPVKVGYEVHWMGLMTDDVESEKIDQLKSTSFGHFKCHPIIVPKAAYNSYYNKYCNNVISPSFIMRDPWCTTLLLGGKIIKSLISWWRCHSRRGERG